MRPRISDIFTTSRIVLVCIFAGIVSFNPSFFQFWGIPIITIIFLTDSFDGWFARKYDKPDKSGSFYDITADRVTEIVFLIPFVFNQVASPLLIVYFVAKGFVIDHIRLRKYINTNKVPYEQGKGLLFNLVKSRFMRAFYGFIKVVMVLLFYSRLVYPETISQPLTDWVALITVAVSIIRTIPAMY